MGIKTRFNPMGGQNEKGSLGEWRYSTAANGQITLYEYLGNYSSIKPVYVPVKRGKTVINDYTSGSTTAASNTPFFNNPNVKMVDLQNVPYVNNDMSITFSNCQNLTFVNNINSNVTNMAYTFSYCKNFNQNIQIPSSVTNMAYTFNYCTNFNQNIQIPNSVTSMVATFSDCRNFNQNIQIPSSVTNMAVTFDNCRSLNQNIQIPNSVKSMAATFYDCRNLNQNIQIPNSVGLLASTFAGCYNLNQNIQIPNVARNVYHIFADCYNLNQNMQIPNTVEDMSDTFCNCTNLQGTISILSEEVSDMNSAFYGSGLSKNVIFPSRYINNAYTKTRASFVSAGYAVGTAAGNSVNNTAQNAVFTAYDPVSWEGYNAWVGDGANWRLTKWGGIGKAAREMRIKVPTYITSYDTFPTVISNTCFEGVLVLDEIDCNHVPIYPAVSTNFFGNIERATGISIYNFNCQGATQLYCLTYMSPGINSFSTGTPQRGTFFINMPNAITNCQALCGHAKGFSNFYIMGNDDLKVYSMFNACNTKDVNVHFTHVNSINSTNWFRNYSSTYRKNIYLYYTYSNGTATNVYNAYKSNSTYMGTTGNAVTLPSPHYNSTSNFYFYNISEDYCPTNNASWWCCPVNGALRYTGDEYTTFLPLGRLSIPSVLDVRQYPDKYVITDTNTQDMSNMFSGFFKFNVNVSLPLSTTNISRAFSGCTEFNQKIQIPNSVINMAFVFSGCQNLNQNIQIPNSVTYIGSTFFNCRNLNQNIQIPNSVIYMSSTFFNCRSLNQNIQIPNSVIYMSSAFSNCRSLNQNIQIPNSVTNVTYTFSGCTSLQGRINILSEGIEDAVSCFKSTTNSKDVYIPYNYTGTTERTKTFNSFVSAGYLYANGVSNNQHGVTMHDLNS